MAYVPSLQTHWASVTLQVQHGTQGGLHVPNRGRTLTMCDGEVQGQGVLVRVVLQVRRRQGLCRIHQGPYQKQTKTHVRVRRVGVVGVYLLDQRKPNVSRFVHVFSTIRVAAEDTDGTRGRGLHIISPCVRT